MAVPDLEHAVRQSLLEHVDVPISPSAPLDLPSLAVISLVEHFEELLSFRARPADVTAENFGTIERIVAYLERQVR